MRQIVLYGLILGVSLLLIQYTQYRLLWIQHSEPLYTGIVAAICCAAGIWGGIALTQKWQSQMEGPLPVVQEGTVFAPDEKIIAQLNITPRELEVLALIAQGLSNREIAAHLFLSLNTIKTHTSNVFSKLEVQRRTQAIQKAKALGVIG
jgi:NarL family two-component system response regulator LiaR